MNNLRYILILFSIFFFQVAISDECKNFEDKVLAIPYPDNGYVTDGQQPKQDIGIFFHKEYDFENDEMKIRRDDKNYPIVKFSFIERKIKPLTSLVEINDSDLSQSSDKKILEFLKNKNLKIKTALNTYTIQATEYDLYPFDLEYFTINAIDEIKTKEGEFKLDYAFQVTHERPDWLEAGREIGNLTICPVDELVLNSKVYSPVTNQTIYLNQVGYDQDKNSVFSEQVYFKDLDKTYTWATFEGIARIKANFDLKKFPFDEQDLSIELFPPYGIEYNDDGNYPKPFITVFSPRKNVYLDLERYKDDNFLKEWTIIKTDVQNSIELTKSTSNFDRDKIVENIEDRITLNITVKRNINYFIFKIIIPVFLILSIAWSVMWIPPIQVESRLTTSIVGLLSLIAYNFVFNDDLPKLSYLTSLDRYILLSYLFCAIPTFLTIYFSRLTKKDYNIALAVNKKSRIVGMIIYLFSTAVIFS